MFSKIKKQRPAPVSTHQLEENLDKSYASLQSQLELVDKLQRIFGEQPSDPVIRFQIQKIKNSLKQDIKRLSFTGTDIHDLQEQFGSDLVRSQIINSRKTIEQEKEGHGQLTDLINDDDFAKAYRRVDLEKQDPMIKAAMGEHIQQEILSDPSRQALQDYYFRKGMPLEKAFNKSMQEYKQYQLRDQEKVLLGLLRESQSKLPTKQLEQIAKLNIDEDIDPEQDLVQVSIKQLEAREESKKEQLEDAERLQKIEVDRLENEARVAAERVEELKEIEAVLFEEQKQDRAKKVIEAFRNMAVRVRQEREQAEKEAAEQEKKFKKAQARLRLQSPQKQRLDPLVEPPKQKAKMQEEEEEEEDKKSDDDQQTRADTLAVEKDFPNISKQPYYKSLQNFLRTQKQQSMLQTVKKFREEFVKKETLEQKENFKTQFIEDLGLQLSKNQKKRVRDFFDKYSQQI